MIVPLSWSTSLTVKTIAPPPALAVEPWLQAEAGLLPPPLPRSAGATAEPYELPPLAPDWLSPPVPP